MPSPPPPEKKKHNVVSKVFHGFLRIMLHIFLLYLSFHQMMVAHYFEVFPCGEVPGEVLQGTQRRLDGWMVKVIMNPNRESRNRSEPGKCVGRCGPTCFSCANVQFQAWGFEYLLDAVGEANLIRTSWIMH